mgnify:CR=1 FL=1
MAQPPAGGGKGTFMIIGIIIVALIVIVVAWVVSTQRGLVHTDELCGNALSQIGVQQASRWDALTALAQLTKNYSEHEYKALMDTVGARRPIDAHSKAAEVDRQENMITEAFTHLMAVAEAYPDLKAQQVYKQTMDSVNQYENNVRRSRMVYNDTVTKFNRMVRQIPGCFLAGPLGFSVREYLETEKGKTDMPSMA